MTTTTMTAPTLMGPRLTHLQPGREYLFQPLVTVRLTDDGQVAVDIDWSDSFVHTWDAAAGGGGDEVDDSPGETAAGEHLDRLIAAGTLPSGTGCVATRFPVTGTFDPVDFWNATTAASEGWPHPYPVTDGDVVDAPDHLDHRYVLVEESRHDGSRYLTSHPDEIAALAYHRGQEDAEGWKALFLYDQAAGVQFSPDGY